jgi:hypothetical protein
MQAMKKSGLGEICDSALKSMQQVSTVVIVPHGHDNTKIRRRAQVLSQRLCALGPLRPRRRDKLAHRLPSRRSSCRTVIICS